MISTRRLYNGLDPVKQLAAQKCDLMVNLSASPWNYGKGGVRQTLVTDAARALGCPVAYVNAVGGNDELIFDGRSLVSDASGRVVAGLAAFAEDLAVVETQPPQGPPSPSPRPFEQPEMADIYARLDARPARLRPQVRLPDGPHCPFRRHRLGRRRRRSPPPPSGPQNVIGVSLPSLISSQHSRDDAAGPGRRTSASALRRSPSPTSSPPARRRSARSSPAGPPTSPRRTSRPASAGVLMMALSNKFGALLLTTGNKSEMAVGYCTLYGDMCGGLAVISDVFKTQVYALANWINADARRAGRAPPIPQSSIDKPRARSCGRTRPTRTACPPTTSSTPSSRATSRRACPRRDLVGAGLRRGRRQATSSAKSISTSTSASRRRPGSRSPPSPSASAGGSRSSRNT